MLNAPQCAVALLATHNHKNNNKIRHRMKTSLFPVTEIDG